MTLFCITQTLLNSELKASSKSFNNYFHFALKLKWHSLHLGSPFAMLPLSRKKEASKALDMDRLRVCGKDTKWMVHTRTGVSHLFGDFVDRGGAWPCLVGFGSMLPQCEEEWVVIFLFLRGPRETRGCSSCLFLHQSHWLLISSFHHPFPLTCAKSHQEEMCRWVVSVY